MRLGLTLCVSIVAWSGARSQQLSPSNADRVGAYRDGPGDYVVVSTLGTGARQMLLLAETRTEQLRLLFPTVNGGFQAGAFLTDAYRIEKRVEFQRQRNGVAALVVTDARLGSPRVFPRMEIDRREVEFANGDVKLRGTLYTPRNATRRAPAIVLAHGSEASDRNSFGPLPWVLSAHGFVVLTYDKRGTGTSTGSWKEVGLERLGADLAKAVDYLAGRPDVDRDHIGVVGTSEGAWVAANATRRTPRIRAVVAISGGAQTKGDAYIHKMKRLAIESGLDGARLDSAVAEAALTITESKQRIALDSSTVSAFDRRVTYDPGADWRLYKGAFLYMGGEMDVLEPATESARWLDSLFASAHHPDYTIKLLPLGHHSLVRGVKGTPSEFSTMSGLRELVPGYWSILLKWLDDRLKPDT